MSARWFATVQSSITFKGFYKTTTKQTNNQRRTYYTKNNNEEFIKEHIRLVKRKATRSVPM